uniref:NADH-ubiquinone oxidoreductase chain 2 n=1 Tax=Bovicola bovis TaxID=160097 RepID=A0A386B268_9NEOP|nr:NADH dehydrogenase subunit 2 [Bovicola bovis]
MVWSLSYSLSLILGFLISVSSDALLPIWWAMEVSGLVFLGWLFMNASLSEREDSPLWTYYLVQSLGGLMVLLGLGSPYFLGVDHGDSMSTMWESGLPPLSTLFQLIMSFGVMVKLGVPPFHGWVVRLSDNLPWGKFFGLMVAQKIIPLVFVSNLCLDSGFSLDWLSVSTIMCAIVSLQGVMESSLRRFMSYSSIMNLGWVLLSINSSSLSNSFKFFLLYLLLMSLVCQVLKEGQVSSSSQAIGGRFYQSKPAGVLTSILVISLMGMPPLPVFLVKIEILRDSMCQGFELCSISLIMSTIILILGYIRLVIYSMMISPSPSKGMIFPHFYWVLSAFISTFLSVVWYWLN